MEPEDFSVILCASEKSHRFTFDSQNWRIHFYHLNQTKSILTYSKLTNASMYCHPESFQSKWANCILWASLSWWKKAVQVFFPEWALPRCQQEPFWFLTSIWFIYPFSSSSYRLQHAGYRNPAQCIWEKALQFNFGSFRCSFDLSFFYKTICQFLVIFSFQAKPGLFITKIYFDYQRFFISHPLKNCFLNYIGEVIFINLIYQLFTLLYFLILKLIASKIQKRVS